MDLRTDPAEEESQRCQDPVPQLKQVKSFSIFDGILARRVPDPSDIFSIMEENSGVSGFRGLRIQAQAASGGTFGDIYAKLQEMTDYDDD